MIRVMAWSGAGPLLHWCVEMGGDIGRCITGREREITEEFKKPWYSVWIF